MEQTHNKDDDRGEIGVGEVMHSNTSKHGNKNVSINREDNKSAQITKNTQTNAQNTASKTCLNINTEAKIDKTTDLTRNTQIKTLQINLNRCKAAHD